MDKREKVSYKRYNKIRIVVDIDDKFRVRRSRRIIKY
jgi:hypothetical protein